MESGKTKQLRQLLRRRHIVRPRDLDALGIPRNYLLRLLGRGQLHRVGRGLYTSGKAALSEHETLLQVSHRIPAAIICLLSALRFHNIGTQIPSEVWIAIDVKAWRPKLNYPPIRVVRFSGAALRFGVQEHRLSGDIVKVYSAAKTVADCFKFRHKIGIDVAIEALRECYRHKKASNNELWEAAKICRVAKVIRPYMETLA